MDPLLHQKPLRPSAPGLKKLNQCQVFDTYRLSSDLEDLGWTADIVLIYLLHFRKQGLVYENFFDLGENPQDLSISSKLLKTFASLERNQVDKIMANSIQRDCSAIEKQSGRKIGVAVRRKDGSFPRNLLAQCAEVWYASPQVAFSLK